MMKPIAVIFGANGFLGRYLCRHWARKGYEIVAVARRRDGWSGDGMFLPWDGKNSGPWELALEGASVVVNLAGRSVNCRYDEKNRAEILESRVDSTRAIGKAIRQCAKPPALWINASTATIYRDASDAPQDEWKGEPGSGFSVNVAQKWEEAFFRDPSPAVVRKVAVRTGIVMAWEERSAFAMMRKIACVGLGGALSGGRQRVSWIHMDDWLTALDFLAGNPLLDGVFNVTAPECPEQRDFQQVLREQVAMPIGLPATEWMVKLGAWALGTEAELVLKSRWAEPARLLDEGFRFRWTRWEPAANDLLQRRGMDGFFRQRMARPVGIRAWAQAT
jgi:uncharacterized protein (TIGR01777 family)